MQKSKGCFDADFQQVPLVQNFQNFYNINNLKSLKKSKKLFLITLFSKHSNFLKKKKKKKKKNAYVKHIFDRKINFTVNIWKQRAETEKKNGQSEQNIFI